MAFFSNLFWKHYGWQSSDDQSGNKLPSCCAVLPERVHKLKPGIVA